MTDLPPTVGTRVRRAGSVTAAGPSAPPPPVATQPAPHTPTTTPRFRPSPHPRTVDVDQGAGKPRSKPRPMPEHPVNGYAPYRLWGQLPPEASRKARIVDWFLGHPHTHLYTGISSRAGFVRWVEHSDTKYWAGDVDVCERDNSVHWATLYDAIRDRAGNIIMVFDPQVEPDGVRPLHVGERVHTEPTRHEYRRASIDVFTLDPVAGVELPGTVIEGAYTGERRLIQAEPTVHNIEGNDGHAGAVNRVTRILPRHVRDARIRAGWRAAGWLASAGVLAAWWQPAGSGLAGWAGAFPGALVTAAVLLVAAQIVVPLTRGPRRARRRPRTVSRRGRTARRRSRR